MSDRRPTHAKLVALAALGLWACSHEPSLPLFPSDEDAGPPSWLEPVSEDGGSPISYGDAGASSGLPCDVQSFLTSHCMECHDGESGKAPFALTTRADLLAPAPGFPDVQVGARALVRIADPVRPMPPAGALPDAVRAPFASWLSAGMPAGDCSDGLSTVLPFEPASPASALAKIKTLLTSEAVSDDELTRYTADPTVLPALIDSFIASAQFEPQLLAFFRTAFQQTELLPDSLGDQLGATKLFGDATAVARLLENLSESFARTALDIVRDGQPFHTVLTTSRFELTTALTSLLLVIDRHHLDDDLKLTQPGYAFDVRTEGAAIPFADSIDPSSPSYLHFTAIGATDGCATTTRSSRNDIDLFQLLLGSVPRAPSCNRVRTPPSFDDADFSDFHPVEIVALGAKGMRLPYFALPSLRGLSTVSLSIPRVGFFTTPAFFANWATNDANQHRVTTNQTLIVALGASFDGSDTTLPTTRAGLSAEHGDVGTACYACHKTLDPMRMFFRQSFTYADHEQLDELARALPAEFAFQGVDDASGRGVRDLAQALAAHPRFATAWVERLCYFANSAPCAPDDPELARVAAFFVQSGFDFKALIRELFSSPLVTQRARTLTVDRSGASLSIARRDHLCSALSNRLGLDDACGLGSETLTPLQKAAEVVASSLPYDAYSRGSEAPVTLSDTSLFFRGATENLCAIVAQAVVDVDMASRFRHQALDGALADMVASVMNLPASDPRSPGALAILREHYDAATAAGSTPTVALRSSFVLACSAPSSVAIGL